MPLELALPPGPSAWFERLPAAWRTPLLQLALGWAGLIALTWRDWAEMAHQWWDISTYNHILLILPILAWLVRLRWPELSRLAPRAWWPGLALLLAGALTWFTGAAYDINLISQAGAVIMLQSAVPLLLGPRVAAGVLFPLGYIAFLVPFGEEIVPVLQGITAKMAVELTHLSGVPASVEGVFIDTPAGLFEVAEACSGVKFLVAMVALGTLAAHLCFASWKRRAVFMAAAVVVPVLANGVRAWGTIYIAQSQGIEFAAGFDHIVYGWIFFAVVMAVLLGAAWRFFDRSPDDPLVDAESLDTSPLLGRMARFGMGGWRALAAVLLVAAAAAWMDGIVRLP
jgi:exosortase A